MQKTIPSLAWLTDPTVFAINRLAAHADYAYYDSLERADKKEQTLARSLNGTWQFAYYENVEAMADELAVEVDDVLQHVPQLACANSIQVPGHLELQGYGQIHYTNYTYPWDGRADLLPPAVDMAHNAIGVYQRQFDLTEDQKDKRIVLSFAGVERAFYVWLNGCFVGYGEDSFTPSEFDITDAVLAEANTLVVAVFSHSSASWLEDQDFFRFTGIFRDVTVYAKPVCHVEDARVVADWDPASGCGRLSLDVQVSQGCVKNMDGDADLAHAAESGREKEGDIREDKSEFGGYALRFELWDNDGKCLWSRDEELACANSSVSIDNITIDNITPWHVSAPNLYNLTITVAAISKQTATLARQTAASSSIQAAADLDCRETMIEIIPLSIGFRRLEIVDNVITLNGQRLLINGVNRHEWSPTKGRAIGACEMQQDIAILKENNINAVRTSHYPNQDLWYQLCDEAGILMVGEANLESHGSFLKLGFIDRTYNVPGSHEEWTPACLDRAKSMYERYKNHPAILFWSAGNESHAGTVIQHMCEYFHQVDDTRLVHYEGVFFDRDYDFITDVESRMYASPEEVRAYLENQPAKPYLLCEYMHCMGNSVGGMESYMRLREEFPAFAGGFIWDYADQALYHDVQLRQLSGDEKEKDVLTVGMIRESEDGESKSEVGLEQGMKVQMIESLGYGGDFADRPTEYNFSGNGIVAADRTPKPALEEVRYWYMDEAKRKAFDEENARKRQEQIRHAKMLVQGGTREAWAINTDDELAQANCAFATQRNTTVKDERHIHLIHSDAHLGISGDHFHYIFALGGGGPVSLVVDGKEQLYRAPKPTFWRAPTENDMGCDFPARSSMWAGADLYTKQTGVEVREYGLSELKVVLSPADFITYHTTREDITEVEICYTFTTSTTPTTDVTVSYRVNAAGRIKVTLSYQGKPSLPELPCFGWSMQSMTPIDRYSWQGLGGETYPDRYKGARVGTYLWESDVAAETRPWGNEDVMIGQETSASTRKTEEPTTDTKQYDAIYHAPLPPYLVPQECCNHADTTLMTAGKLLFVLDEAPFHFSVLPWTPQELESAKHIYELPPSACSTIRILGAMRGVGGIDSWGADVEENYRISAEKDMTFSFYILPQS